MGVNPQAQPADLSGVSQLPTRDDLLRRKALERDEAERPRLRALAIERDLAAARSECWQLLDEFVARAQELGVNPRVWEAKARPGSSPRITRVEGYPLTSGAFVSAPPLSFVVAERRLVRTPRLEVRRIEELSLFVVSPGEESRAAAAQAREHHTASQGGWPHMRAARACRRDPQRLAARARDEPPRPDRLTPPERPGERSAGGLLSGAGAPN